MATLTLSLAALAQAQANYPARPIRFVVPQGTGGSTDIAARLFGQKLGEAFGQQVVIDNRAGAGGIIGADLVAKAAPDGYTLMISSFSQAVLPSLHKKLPYDILRDFAPVSLLVSTPFLILVHPSVPAKSLKELIAYANAKPGQLNYASQGNGTSAHITAELFRGLTGITAVHVPYKGAAAALTALLAGESGMAFFTLSGTLQHVRARQLRALATTGEKRSPSLPDVPTVAEAGLPEYKANTWAGVAAPAGTSTLVVGKLHREFTRILQLADVKERLAAMDFDPVGSTPEAFNAFMKVEVAKWAKVLKDAGAKAD